MPKINYREIDVPKVTMRDVTVPNIVSKDVPVDHVMPHDVTVDHVVPHDVPVDHVVPRDVPGPVATVPPLPTAPPAVAEDAPKTPDERKFEDKPEYQKAPYRARIIHSIDGRALSFADGINLYPEHWDPVKSQLVADTDRSIDSDPYVGDIAMCTIDEHQIWLCSAMHNRNEVIIQHHKQNVTPLPPCPPSTSKNGLPILVPRCAPEHESSGGETPADANMVNVDVDVAGYPVKAMVDTGCSFPMAIPTALATTLLHDGRAIFAGETKSLLADGKEVDVGVILIKSITVDGRTLDSVEASVSPSNSAPILLGLRALNRLGAFTIDSGRIVFAGDQLE